MGRRLLRLLPAAATLLCLGAGCHRLAAVDPDAALARAPARSAGARAVADGAVAQIHVTRLYDAAYARIPYPDGDVPPDRGVCADVVVRALRAGGVDLQREVHEDMAAHFAAYPRRWGLARPDPNIDHRRVPNLMTFFARRGRSLPVTGRAADYQPGDVVTWRVGGGFHTGVVSDRLSPSGVPLIVHNIGSGVELEDVLFAWPVLGHYRYFR